MMFHKCLFMVTQLFSTVGLVGDESNHAPAIETVKAESPIEALRSLKAAIRAGDDSAILALTTTKTERQLRVYRDYVRGWSRSVAFFNALESQFDPDETGGFMGVAFLFPTSWVDLNAAKVELHNNEAVVSSEGGWPQKMIRENGRWKAFIADWDEAALARMDQRHLPALAEAMRVVTPRLRKGEYKTVIDVENDFEQLMKATIELDKAKP